MELPRVLQVQQFTAAREPEVRRVTSCAYEPLIFDGEAVENHQLIRLTRSRAAAGPVGVLEVPGTTGWQQAAATPPAQASTK